MSPRDPETFRAAFRSRAQTALRAMDIDTDAATTEEALARLLCAAASNSRGPEAWLAFVALSAVFPTATQLAQFRRELFLAQPDQQIAAALRTAGAAPGVRSAAHRTLTIVADRPVVDVGHTSSSDHNTGIQRVVRRTVPLWEHEAHELVGWSDDNAGYTGLDHEGRHRVLKWGRGNVPLPDSAAVAGAEVLVVPWRTTVILPEVAMPERCAALACLAESSGSRVAMIGYDAIPLVSADLVDDIESERFANYLTIVKHAAVVSAISGAAGDEFSGFRNAVVAQGLPGPEIRTVPLAEDLGVAAGSHEVVESAVPVILCVGSHEARKNQEAVLAAAASLFRAGHLFKLVFVGGGSRRNLLHFDRALAKLSKQGMRVESHRRLGDAELFDLYAAARFCVFVSLHEGYGLPVVESLSHGTPVLTSNYGSLAEIARGGGCLQVDPRSVASIESGMRELLEDDDVIARLGEEISTRPVRTWSDYAKELWTSFLTAPVSNPGSPS
ncbi:glycosyltransferase [Salinibacterium sp. G-O1]|uniref:glycosyltransferase n=1 Tax=Salinibacterium sp. G-O1 TaxID=3046208 RepID=UPI0024B9F969|nr:glycosyltransferase [Salinibacterium sp. G-O1]MDJ0336522.1 glycosyltransferase [Salinibacterium sp. G-O1]